MASDLRIVFSTCGDRETAESIATSLVERRLAACVNVLPGISSTYRWMGKIERDDEVLLMIKTAKTELKAIETEIRALANYDLPELVAVEVTGGATEYLAWVAGSIGGGEA